MKKLSLVHPALGLALGFALATSAQAATVSYGTTFTPGTTDISNLTGTTTDATNVSGGTDAATYVAADQGAQGETFTTGSNPGGYMLAAVTIQNVQYSTTGTYYNTTAGTFTLRIGTISTGAFTQIDAESGAVNTTNNLGTANGQAQTGTGKYVTLTLASSIKLSPNTVYGFDVGSSTTGAAFFETNGTSTDVYSGGVAYTSGTGGAGSGTVTADTGDRAFDVALTAVVPEPSTYALQGSSLAMLTLFRRRRKA